LKDEVLKKQELTCSVGVGGSKLLAKIAANEQKPDGLTVVAPDKVVEFLAPLPVGRLYGVGKKTEKILQDKGVKTVGDLANYPLQELIKTFGKTLGAYFHEAARGDDDSPVQERTGVRSISRITTLKANTRDKDTLLTISTDLSAVVSHRVKSGGLGFRTVSLAVVAEDMSLHTKSLTLDSITDDLQTLKQAVKQLIEVYLRGSDLNARRIGVRVSNLSRVTGQKSLSAYLG
jgi:DNA polymerase IV (DinB-like DNA polymerase)